MAKNLTFGVVLRSGTARVAAAIASLRRTLRPLDIFIVIAAVGSLSLRTMVPPNILPNSPHDDLLGVQLARELLRGQWLGPWNNRVLAKPPGYSIFLAVIHPLGIPPTVAVHILYLLLGFYAIHLLGRSGRLAPAHPLVSRGLFLLFAFNPSVFGGDFSRIYRVSLNSIAALLYVLAFLHLLLILKRVRPGPAVPRRAIALPSLLLGLAYAAMLLTRTEAYWVLLPSMVVLLLIVVGDCFWRRHPPEGTRGLTLYPLIASVAISSTAAVLPLALVRYANKAAYGVAEIDNLRSGNFAKAVNLWTSVRDGRDSRSFIAISRGQREAVYATSPTAATLRSLLETPPGVGWKTHSCVATGVCDESGAWFVFELRDAAVTAGGLTDEVAFQEFFGKIAADISTACRAGRLNCGRAGFTPGARDLAEYSRKQLLDTSMKVLLSLIAFEQARNVGRPDYGHDVNQLALWREAVTFDRVITSSDVDVWRAMGNTIRLLETLYASLSPLLCALTVLALMRGWRHPVVDGGDWFLLYLLGCIGLYCGGMAVFEASHGFSIGFSFYALPVQPVFLLALLTGAGSSASLLIEGRSRRCDSADAGRRRGATEA